MEKRIATRVEKIIIGRKMRNELFENPPKRWIRLIIEEWEIEVDVEGDQADLNKFLKELDSRGEWPWESNCW